MNISNSYANSTASSSLLSTALSSVKSKTFEENNTEFNSDINKTYIIHNSQSYASEYGFRTNEQGFFEKDFNMFASLPFDYDIHIKSVQSIAKELLRQDPELNPVKIDIASVVNKYYNSLKSIESEFQTNDNAMLSRIEISKLNQGFSTKNGELDSELIRIYNTSDEIKEAKKLNNTFTPLNLGIKITDFAFDEAINNNSTNELLKPYMNENGDISKSGLLMNFIHKDLKEANDNNFFIEPVKLSLNAHKNLQKLLNNEDSFKSYILEQNSQNMSFDLYLYVNGVNKQNTSKDKLDTLYQQYIGYQRGVNIKEFVNSSSIFSLYTESLNKEFQKLNTFFSEKQDNLEQISNDVKTLNEKFIQARQKQAAFSNIIKSYIGVMQ